MQELFTVVEKPGVLRNLDIHFLWSGSIPTPQGNSMIIDHFCYQVTTFLTSSLKDNPMLSAII